jgi:DNA-binding Lrp family transcriptional regulator
VKHLPALPEVNIQTDAFKLSERDKQIALALVMKSFTGESVEQVAQRFDLTRDGVHKMIRRQEKEFKRFQAYIHEQLFAGLYEKTLVVLHDALDNAPMSQKIKVAKMVLLSQGKINQSHHVVEVKQTTDLDQLEKEVADLEQDLLDDWEPRS